MAPTAKHFSLLFFLSLLSPQLSHARDLQSFSKLTNTPTTTTTTTATPTANTQETIPVPNKEQEPSFLPDTQNGYGLYGHESGQVPPTTTTTTAPTTNNPPYSYYNKEAYATNPQGMSDTRFVSKGSTTTTDNHPYKEAYVTDSQGYTTTNNNYYYKGANNDYYKAQKEGILGDTKLVDGGYTTTANAAAATTDKHPYKEAYVTDPQGYTTTNKNYYFNGANNDYYNAQQQGLSDTKLVDGGYTTTANAATGTTTTTPANNYNYNGANNYYNTQKQGMSDTRFLENGKYYYDGRRYNNYGNEKSRGVNTVNYNYKGHNGYNENSYMEGYQNQEQFQENEEEYIP